MGHTSYGQCLSCKDGWQGSRIFGRRRALTCYSLNMNRSCVATLADHAIHIGRQPGQASLMCTYGPNEPILPNLKHRVAFHAVKPRRRIAVCFHTRNAPVRRHQSHQSAGVKSAPARWTHGRAPGTVAHTSWRLFMYGAFVFVNMLWHTRNSPDFGRCGYGRRLVGVVVVAPPVLEGTPDVSVQALRHDETVHNLFRRRRALPHTIHLCVHVCMCACMYSM
jgi:hypothetical protein